ncbi:MAG: phenylalanine--tRNA ligase subunit alpha [Holosporales bacterium]|jgi:phenylalanyl-tRNA synthetase alpha chain|nr:phenylalanine--tRNA ligase subunit alpha [Holosporales bacterium]
MPLEDDLKSWLDSIARTKTFLELEKIKIKTIGKSGVINLAFKELANMPADQKKSYGENLNNIKNTIEEALTARYKQLEELAIYEKLSNESVDVTLPVENENFGGLHLITQLIRKIKMNYQARGFLIADGPEIETEFFNFDALNIPEHHPSRQSHDTFYIDGFDKTLLRTHTSPVQIRMMIEHGIPIRMISIGKTYRNDQLDATHSPMFHQLEGLVVDRNPINVRHLKRELKKVLAIAFDAEDIEIRLRPSFFPFTEPGIEVDYWYKNRWLEICGAGMVHPNVFKNCNITDPVFGFAFGFGIERVVMIKNGINDIRNLFGTDIRFLKYYGRVDIVRGN